MLVFSAVNPAANYTALLRDLRPSCDANANDLATYRRISSAGGQTGLDRSVLWSFVQPSDVIIGDDCGPHGTDLSAANRTILEAWIRNSAPDN
jgi:hypothetical protein